MFGLSPIKTVTFLFFIFSLFTLQSAYADCKLCEKIREENAKKVNPYEYYEDYLEAQKQGKEDHSSKIEFSEDEEMKEKKAN